MKFQFLLSSQLINDVNKEYGMNEVHAAAYLFIQNTSIIVLIIIFALPSVLLNISLTMVIMVIFHDRIFPIFSKLHSCNNECWSKRFMYIMNQSFTLWMFSFHNYSMSFAFIFSTGTLNRNICIRKVTAELKELNHFFIMQWYHNMLLACKSNDKW